MAWGKKKPEEKIFGQGTENNQCFFCDAITKLDDHHFPIPKRDGGKEVVFCCGPCHDSLDRMCMDNWPVQWISQIIQDFQLVPRQWRLFMAKVIQTLADFHFRDQGVFEKMKIKEGNLKIKECFIDTETTSNDPATTGLWQIGGIVRINGVVEERFQIQCDVFEGCDVNEEVLMNMHGKTMKELSKLQAPEDANYEFIKMLGKYVDKYNTKDKFFFIGYGAEFDWKVLRKWFDDLGDQYFGSWFYTPWIDVMTLAAYALRGERPEMKNFALNAVLDYVGIEYNPRKLHTALYDATITMELFDEIKTWLER